MPAPTEITAISGEHAEMNSAEDEYFDDKELDMLRKPRKYKVRFAIWDKIKSIISDDDVQNDKNAQPA